MVVHLRTDLSASPVTDEVLYISTKKFLRSTENGWSVIPLRFDWLWY